MTSQLSPAKPLYGRKSELEKLGLRAPQTGVYSQLCS